MEDRMSSRKRTPDQETPAETPATVAEPPAAANDNAPAGGDNKPSFAERVGGPRKWPMAPDPFGIASDKLAGVRLFESKDDRQMALKFEDKLSQAVIDKLKAEGYHWQPANRVWAHEVWPSSSMSTRIKAERLYQEVRAMIRQEKGIEATQEIPF